MNTRTSISKSSQTLPGWLHATVALILFMAVTGPVHAQDWRFEPELRAGGEFDDNAELSDRTDLEVDLSGYLLEAAVKFEYTSPENAFYFTPRALFRKYSSDSVFDSDDQFLNSEYSHNTQSSTYSLRLSYERENVRTAERGDAGLDDIDPGDIPDDETGLVDIRDRRQSFHARPRWEYRFSNTSRIDTRFDYFDVNYDESLASGDLTDYSDARLRISYQRDFSARNTGILTATARNYNAESSFDETTGYGIAAGLTRNLTETSVFRALVGVANTERFAAEDDQSFVFDFYLRQRLETILLIAQYRRNVNASGEGRLTARDSINIRFTRQLSEKLSAGLGVRAYQTNALGGGNINERDYVQLRSLITWHLTPKFSVEANYRYTFIRRGTLEESANSNNVQIWFTYRPAAAGDI